MRIGIALTRENAVTRKILASLASANVPSFNGTYGTPEIMYSFASAKKPR